MKHTVLVDGTIIGPRKTLRPTVHHTGYAVVTMNIHGKPKQYRVHRVVWEFFNGPIPADKMIDHIDGDKLNNALSNLRLATAKENARYARQMRSPWSHKGEDVVGAKLTNEQFKEVVAMLVGGKSNSEIAECFGLNSGYVSLIRHRKRWQHLWDEHFKDVVVPLGTPRPRPSKIVKD